MVKIDDKYISVPLHTIKSKPNGKAKFLEPIFKMGRFLGGHVEVEVTTYPDKVKHPTTGEELTAVRFGQMNIIRFVETKFLYDMRNK